MMGEHCPTCGAPMGDPDETALLLEALSLRHQDERPRTWRSADWGAVDVYLGQDGWWYITRSRNFPARLRRRYSGATVHALANAGRIVPTYPEHDESFRLASAQVANLTPPPAPRETDGGERTLVAEAAGDTPLPESRGENNVPTPHSGGKP